VIALTVAAGLAVGDRVIVFAGLPAVRLSSATGRS
jgi:hypothetical protein